MVSPHNPETADPALTANGYPLDQSPERFGRLAEANHLLSDASALQETMRKQGYLFFRQLLSPDVVLRARQEILQKYAILGEIDDQHPVTDGIEGSRFGVGTANLRAFSQSIRSGHWYLQVTDAPELLGVHEALLGGTVRSFDFRWPRLARPGEGCGFHCDGPYMARGTDTARIFTSWIPLGRVRLHEGALILLEDSHRSETLHSGYLRMDADRDGLTWLDDDPVKVQERFGGRWLSIDFQPGDVLCFTMHTLHGALDNQSKERRCRLTSDTRYQRADEPADPRWNGETIEGHGGNRVFYPGLGNWNNVDFQDEWKRIDDLGRLATDGGKLDPSC